MIRFSNSHSFEYMAASGALAFDGLGWPWEKPFLWTRLLDPQLFTTVIKTLTFEPRVGNLRWYNPLGRIRFLPGGILNAVGLTNPGIDWWCKEVGPNIDSTRRPLVGSILGEVWDLVRMAQILNEFDLVGLEINASCPNTEEDILTNTSKVIESCEMVQKISRFPIILKLSVVHDVKTIVPRVEGIVEALAINSVPWSIAFPNRKSPFAHLGGGGVSGKVAQPFTWKLVNILVESTNIPVIGPSVWDYGDIETLRIIGAKAVGFGSIFLRFPWRPTAFVRRDGRR